MPTRGVSEDACWISTLRLLECLTIVVASSEATGLA